MKVKINQFKTHTDIRGMVFEPIEKESICIQKNCHIVISKPGIIRGNHFHLFGTETAAVMGPALLKFEKGTKIYDFIEKFGLKYYEDDEDSEELEERNAKPVNKRRRNLIAYFENKCKLTNRILNHINPQLLKGAKDFKKPVITIWRARS